MTSRCIVGPGRFKETSVVVRLTICIHAFKYVLWFLPTSIISFDPFVLFGVLLLVLMWWRFVPWPLVPRRNLGPRVCGHHAIVLLGARWCLWTKLHRQFFLWNLWNHFSLVWSFKGVGPRRITVRTGCLGLSFWVLSTNWHGIMCITHHATSLMNTIEQEYSWEKFTLMPFLFSFPELLKIRHDVFFYLDSPPKWEFDSSRT